MTIHFLAKHFLTHEMNINLDMFSYGMKKQGLRLIQQYQCCHTIILRIFQEKYQTHETKDQIQINFVVAEAKAQYSDLVLLLATTCCFLELQLIKLPPRKT